MNNSFPYNKVNKQGRLTHAETLAPFLYVYVCATNYYRFCEIKLSPLFFFTSSSPETVSHVSSRVSSDAVLALLLESRTAQWELTVYFILAKTFV